MRWKFSFHLFPSVEHYCPAASFGQCGQTCGSIAHTSLTLDYAGHLYSLSGVPLRIAFNSYWYMKSGQILYIISKCTLISTCFMHTNLTNVIDHIVMCCCSCSIDA